MTIGMCFRFCVRSRANGVLCSYSQRGYQMSETDRVGSKFYWSILSGVLFMPEQSILLGNICDLNRIEMRAPDSAVGLLRVEAQQVMNRAPEQTNRSDSRERRY